MRGDGTLFRYKRSAVWWGRYYLHGTPQTFSTGNRDKDKARIALRQKVAEVLTGQAVPEQTHRLRYEDLEAGLLADYRTRERRSLKDLPRVLKPLREAFAAWPALAITTAKSRAYTAARLDAKAAPATINKELATLGRMLTLAVLDGRLKVRPPVPKLPTDNARRGFLEPADFEAFAAELPADLQPLARFAYLTGWRRGEVLGLQWRQVDLDAGAIRLENDQTKTGKGRMLAFSPDDAIGRLLRAQEAQRRPDCGHVFSRNGRPIRDFYTAWRAAAERAGLAGLYLHDFRRSTARNLIRAGVPERVAMSVTGHKTRAIFDRYNIVSEGDLREATAKVAAYVETNSRKPRRVTPLRTASGTDATALETAEPSDNRQSEAI